MRTQTRTRALILVAFLMLALAACKANTGEPYAMETNTPGTAAAARQPVQAATVTQPAAQASLGTQSAPEGCTVVSQAPTPGPTEQSLFPAVNDEDWKKGPSTAYLTIMEYSDFQ